MTRRMLYGIVLAGAAGFAPTVAVAAAGDSPTTGETTAVPDHAMAEEHGATPEFSGRSRASEQPPDHAKAEETGTAPSASAR